MGTFRGKGLLGVKLGMTSIFTETGDQIPVTVVLAGPNTVLGLRPSADGKYTSMKLGFGEIREKLLNKPQLGNFKKVGVKPTRYVREFRLSPKDAEGIAAGASLDVDTFAANQWIDVTGTSKGKGFAGVVKMHHMKGQGARGSHGVHEYHRHVGAIGQRKTPGRVYPGKRMPGHMGVERVTLQNLRVVSVDTEQHLILVHGAIPGHPESLIVLRPAIKPPRLKKVEEKKAVNPLKASKRGGGA